MFCVLSFTCMLYKRGKHKTVTKQQQPLQQQHVHCHSLVS